MKILPLILALLFFISCTENKQSNNIKNTDTTKNIIPSSVDTPIVTQKDTNADDAPTLFKIEGNYIVEENESSCKLELKLYYKNKQLYYQLVTNTKKYADKAEIELNEEKDGYYITFKNIEWSENEGALDDEGEPIDKEITLPQDIQGVMYKNEITIQNSGNSMNYYVKIGDCDLKFIRLIKK